jgi:hypothetical protein
MVKAKEETSRMQVATGYMALYTRRQGSSQGYSCSPLSSPTSGSQCEFTTQNGITSDIPMDHGTFGKRIY